jgi:hypothetical protein
MVACIASFYALMNFGAYRIHAMSIQEVCNNNDTDHRDIMIFLDFSFNRFLLKGTVDKTTYANQYNRDGE